MAMAGAGGRTPSGAASQDVTFDRGQGAICVARIQEVSLNVVLMVPTYGRDFVAIWNGAITIGMRSSSVAVGIELEVGRLTAAAHRPKAGKAGANSSGKTVHARLCGHLMLTMYM